MKRFCLVLAFLLVFAGCNDKPKPTSTKGKEALQLILAPSFNRAFVPTGKVDDFYLVLKAFDEVRSSDDFVSAIDFRSETEILLWIEKSSKHDEGGLAEVRKNGGVWTVTRKSYQI